MGKVLRELLSMKTVITLLLAYGLFSGIATFIENDFGMETSWAVIYNALWFELIQLALGIVLIYNLFHYNLFRQDKVPSLLFHISFLFILVGAGITRYYGFEGSLHIREGEQENRLISTDSFIQVSAKTPNTLASYDHKQLISAIGGNAFSFAFDVGGESAKVRFKELLHNATKKVVDDPSGVPMISMMLSGYGESVNIVLKEGESYETTEYRFSFNAPPKEGSKKEVALKLDNGAFSLHSAENIGWFKMAENSKGEYEGGKAHPFITGQLYTIGAINFAPRYIGLKGKEKVVEETQPMTKGKGFAAVVVELEYRGEKSDIALLGRGKGSIGRPTMLTLGGADFRLEWGSKVFTLPFNVKLNAFILDRYPGSMSPMSYASEVEVVDEEKGVHVPYRIYMNHVLDYRGFRFFQSSYDQDEKGTILSVNSDPGKWPTYIGYMLLSLGLFLNLLNPKSRFRKLAMMVQRDTMRYKTAMIACLLALSVVATPAIAQDVDASLSLIKRYDKHHADQFGSILVQSVDGRIKPIDTVSTEVLNKVHGKATYQGLSANQVVLSMMSSPGEWQIQPFVKVFHPELKKIIGIPESQKYAAFSDFFEQSGERAFKLTRYSEEANRKKPAERNQFDKDVLKVDERVNICYMVFTGEIFKMIPKQNDQSKRWYAPQEAVMGFDKQEGEEVRALLGGYFESLGKSIETGAWSDADAAATKLKAYQEQYGSAIIPSASRIKAEMFFNHAKIFQRLSPIYLLSGFVLLLFIFAKMAKPQLPLAMVVKIVLSITVLSFVMHTFGLALRWYIATHAPWSDGYESMIYIAWAIALSGIFFARQSIVALSLTAILAGVTLFVAHLSWMDPQITNLVHVLKSYWLNIHVSVITASYGFLGLCSLLGFFTLILFIIRKKNNEEIDRQIVEATRINEMAMILGLSLLTVGNFLGGVWANESWGRYWGWDPKETWALVSIVVYAAVVHFRFVPKLNSPYAFAVASTISFAVIIMTYFGVNFYLSGMHSYAAGDPVPIPNFVYYTVAIVFTVIALAYPKRAIAKTL